VDPDEHAARVAHERRGSGGRQELLAPEREQVAIMSRGVHAWCIAHAAPGGKPGGVI
jgi:hypothetical protein